MKTQTVRRFLQFALLTAGLLLVGCTESAEPSTASPAAPKKTLAEARQGFSTKLVRQDKVGEPVPEPPAKLFRSVTYHSPVGDLAAYVGVSPNDGKKHPAIIWIIGGFANGISEIAWEPGPAENDQSATAFREAGLVMMYASLRGGNKNPRYLEGFYGEVDDILAAADYLGKLDYVDPKHIYLGGHSTGGTLALLVAESSDKFRAVFSFGPVGDIRVYGPDRLPFTLLDGKEAELRSPVKWLHAIRTPTFIFEGNDQRSNYSELLSLNRANKNPLVHVYALKGATHFSGLRPVSRLIASKLMQDNGPAPNLSFTDAELAKALEK